MNLRLIDPDGYTVPGTVHTDVPEANQPKVRALLEDAAVADAAKWADFGHHAGDYRIVTAPAIRIAHSPQPERTLMTHQATALPLDPARLADLLLAPAADANGLHQQLADQVDPRPARQLLAAAHSIAADRLDAEVGIHYDGCTSAEGASDDPSDHYGQ